MAEEIAQEVGHKGTIGEARREDSETTAPQLHIFPRREYGLPQMPRARSQLS
jgi:hypothetical protein